MDATLDQSLARADDCFLMNFFPPFPEVPQLQRSIVFEKSNTHTDIHLFRSVSLCPTVALKLSSYCTYPKGKCQLKPYTRAKRERTLKFLFHSEVYGITFREKHLRLNSALHANLVSGLGVPITSSTPCEA